MSTDYTGHCLPGRTWKTKYTHVISDWKGERAQRLRSKLKGRSAPTKFHKQRIPLSYKDGPLPTVPDSGTIGTQRKSCNNILDYQITTWIEAIWDYF